MPLFQMAETTLRQIGQTNFQTEKELQRLIEANMEIVFNCRFVASEFPTGSVHGGRIDTLALSEDDNPVIIEYKKVESSELVNQSLYYLAWINDHRGDFQIAVQRKLGNQIKVDWADIRVICIAPNYKKFDLHAVKVMGANIELWTYRSFKNGSIYFEEVFRKSMAVDEFEPGEKDPAMVAAGKKAAQTRLNASYTVEQHFVNKPKDVQDLARSVQEFAMGLDPSMEEVPKKFYIAYKISQNILCMELRKHKVILYLKLNPKDIKNPPRFFRDVTSIGHYGTGDVEFSISDHNQLEEIKKFITRAYENIGG